MLLIRLFFCPQQRQTNAVDEGKNGKEGPLRAEVDEADVEDAEAEDADAA